MRNGRTSSTLYDSAAARPCAGHATHFDLEKRVEALVGELGEALEQQMATSGGAPRHQHPRTSSATSSEITRCWRY